MIRSLSIVAGLAAAHFFASKIVVALTMHMGMFAAGDSPGAGVLGNFLVGLTRVLYFPVITLSLYSRQRFPGEWVLVPIIANSLLWGITIYAIVRIVKRITRSGAGSKRTA
ncbi:MAG: hypothetical protein WAL90_01080 [Desulfobacterales bacterium]